LHSFVRGFLCFRAKNRGVGQNLKTLFAPKKALFIGAGQKRQKIQPFSGSDVNKKTFF